MEYLRIPVIDAIAFKLVQLTMLIQGYILQVWFHYNPPEGLSKEIEAMSEIHSSFYMAGVDLKDLPEIVQDKVLSAGRMLLLLVVVVGYIAWVSK